MGFIMMPQGLAGLRSFGVALPDIAGGVPLHRYRHRNAAGKIVGEQAMPAGAFAVCRRDLMAALEQALPGDGVLAYGAELDTLRFDASGHVAAARLRSGERIQAGLYVGADGHRSRARQELFPHWPMAQARVMEMVGITGNAQVRHWARCDLNKFHADDGGIAIGLLPVNDEHVVWYLQFDSQRFPPPAPDPSARRVFAHRLVGAWADPIPSALAGCDFSRVHLWRPVNGDLVPRFHQGNLVLVGDAAHPLLPFTSQGVSSAIADAVLLADALAAEDVLGDALAAYSIERRQHRAPFVAQGRALTRNFLAPQAASALLPVAQ